MSRKRFPWDGPHPSPGHYLESRSPAVVWLIRAVEPLRRPDISGATLVLDVSTLQRIDLPPDAILHPWSRVVLSDPAGPPRVRQVQPGGQQVMKTVWRDPEDMRVNARRAREITGWRSLCMLRRMQQVSSNGSRITEEHVLAADYFRYQCDLAMIGRSARDGLLPVTALTYGPKMGLSPSGEELVRAAREVRRTLARFTLEQRMMLVQIVLLNQSIDAWLGYHASGREHEREMGKLEFILDTLVEHNAAAVQRAMEGRIERAA